MACATLEEILKDCLNNSGGIYTGVGGITQKGTPNEVAIQSMVYKIRER